MVIMSAYNINTMTFSVRRAFVDGVPRAFQRNGRILIGAYLLATFLQVGLAWLTSTAVLPLGSSSAPVSGGQMPTPGTQLPPAIGFLAYLIASFAGYFLTIPILVVAYRTFVSQFTDHIPEEFVFHRLGWATSNCFLGMLVLLVSLGVLTIVLFGFAGLGLVIVGSQSLFAYLFGTWPGRALLIGTGFILLLPIVFLGTSLIFVEQEIAIQDKNVSEAIVGSWQLAQHNRLTLSALLLLFLISLTILSLVASLFLPQVLTQIVYSIGAVILQTVWLAVMARAYVQLHNSTETIDERLPHLTGSHGFE